MDSLSTVPGVDIARLRRSKLSLDEEFAEQVARESVGFRGLLTD
jgi:hypothetical protein